jgi:hypothetical protein
MIDFELNLTLFRQTFLSLNFKMATQGTQPTVVETYKKEIHDTHRESTVEEAEQRAHQLREEGQNLLNYAFIEKQRAEEAQRAAATMSAQANRIAEEALNKQIAGQEKLAEAAQKMMEAGQKLQSEAAQVTVAEVPYNKHDVADIRQAAVTTGAVVTDIKQNMYVTRETEVVATNANATVGGQQQVHHESHQQKKFS